MRRPIMDGKILKAIGLSVPRYMITSITEAGMNEAVSRVTCTAV